MSTNIRNYKLVLLGNSAVGKSCLVMRFTRDQFLEYQEPTIGAAFSIATVEVDNIKIRFEIWDTAGQERYRSLAPMYYRGAVAAIIVYDITNLDSFEGAKTWVEEIQKRGASNCVIALAGNKSDLEEYRKVKHEEVEEYAIKNSLLHIITSAKTASNVQDLFIAVAKKVPKEPLKEEELTTRAFLDFDSNKTIKQMSCC